MDPSISLTALRVSDTEFISTLAADQRVTAFIGDGEPWSLQYTKERIDTAISSPGISWFIARFQGARVGLFTAVTREEATEIGYWIAPDHWGQGLAKKIVSLGISALKTVGATELMARVSTENIASLKVLERLGFAVRDEAENILVLHLSQIQD